MSSEVAPNPAAAFTTLWTGAQCRRLVKAGVVGRPLALTFGGPHQSAPRFSRAGVRPGDLVFPVRVLDGRLHVLGRLRVGAIHSAEAFVASYPENFASIDPDEPAFVRLERWIAADPTIAALCPGEADEVILADDATPITLDAVVPTPSVRDLRWQSGRRPERPIKHLDAEGRITSTISLQGVYRLTAPSASILEEALNRVPNRTTP
jgi:hypothetical protein